MVRWDNQGRLVDTVYTLVRKETKWATEAVLGLVLWTKFLKKKNLLGFVFPRILPTDGRRCRSFPSIQSHAKG